MNKISILYVVDNFYQAGAERFMYEIDKALDKNKFATTILCLEKKNNIKPNWKIRFFEKKHLELGTEIIYIDKFLKGKINLIAGKIINKLIVNKTQKNHSSFNSNLSTFINQFQVVHWMGEYTFIHNMQDGIKSKSLIHVMSAKFQNSNLYENFDFMYPYKFISPFMENEVKYELSQFKNSTHFFLPLAMDLTSFKKLWSFKNTTTFKVAIFTRLDKYKPLDPFFYSFQLLLDQLPNSELHIFGNGNAVEAGLIDILKRLAIVDKVFFRGHQDNMSQTIINEHINLAWFQGYKNQRPAGYAGFELCAVGLPLVCWDFFEESPEYCNHIYPHYKNMNQFVTKSITILLDEVEATNLSDNQFNEVHNSRDISKYIGDLQSFYIDVSS